MSGSIRVQANGQTLAVNFTRTNGAAASVFSDAGLTSAVSLPATISSDTYFYFPTPETYVVSVKLNGVEIASNAGGTLTQFLHGNASTTIAPSVDGFTERAAVDAGAYAPITELVNTVAASGAATTLPDATFATVHDVTLTAACTLTFPTPTAGRSLTLVLRQDGTGSRLVTWPASVKWAAGTAPTLSTGASKSDLLTFVSITGSSWIGSMAAADYR